MYGASCALSPIRMSQHFTRGKLGPGMHDLNIISDDAMYLSHFTMVCHLKKKWQRPDDSEFTAPCKVNLTVQWQRLTYVHCTTKMSERKLAMMYDMTYPSFNSLDPKLNIRGQARGLRGPRTSLTVEGRTTNCCSISADAAVPAAIQAPLVGVGEGCCMEFGIRKSANLTFCGLHGPFEHRQFVKI